MLLLQMGNENTQPCSSSGISTGVSLATIMKCRHQDVAKRTQRRSTCNTLCFQAKTILPYPKTHRTCISGCELGWNEAWDNGCTLSAAHQEQTKCEHDVIEMCGDNFCKKYEFMVPKPLLYNQCITACKKAATNGCSEGKNQVHQLMSRLTDELL